MQIAGGGRTEEQVVVFSLHDQIYGINIESVLEIIKMEPVTRVPGTPDFIEGVINLRGKVIPVMDLGRSFNMPHSRQTADTKVIVVEVGGVTVGVMVDSVSEVLCFPVAGIESPPPVIAGAGVESLRGIALVDGRLIILLDLAKVLHDEERHRLYEFGNQSA